MRCDFRHRFHGSIRSGPNRETPKVRNPSVDIDLRGVRFSANFTEEGMNEAFYGVFIPLSI